MRPNTHYSDNRPKEIVVTNTSNGRQIITEVTSSNDNSVTVFIANEKIVLHKTGNSYVGNKFGMELVYTPE